MINIIFSTFKKSRAKVESIFCYTFFKSIKSTFSYEYAHHQNKSDKQQAQVVDIQEL
jgi:hypothetical protein